MKAGREMHHHPPALDKQPITESPTMRSFIANETRYGYSTQKETSSEKIRIRNTKPASNGLMSEHAFFEYRAKPMSTPHIKEQGEPIHCLIKMEIGVGLRRPRELLKQEARDLILFSVSPGPRRISHSNICEVDEKRLRELGPARDFNRVGSVEIYFYSF
jgi:hypothetical protein